MNTNLKAPTVDLVGDHHLVIYPGRDFSHKVVIARRAIDLIEFSEPHGSRTNYRIAVRGRSDGWIVDLPDLIDDAGHNLAADTYDRVLAWWTERR